MQSYGYFGVLARIMQNFDGSYCDSFSNFRQMGEKAGKTVANQQSRGGSLSESVAFQSAGTYRNFSEKGCQVVRTSMYKGFAPFFEGVKGDRRVTGVHSSLFSVHGSSLPSASRRG